MSNTLKWLSMWLTQRFQHVLVDQNLFPFSLVFLKGQFLRFWFTLIISVVVSRWTCVSLLMTVSFIMQLKTNMIKTPFKSALTNLLRLGRWPLIFRNVLYWNVLDCWRHYLIFIDDSLLQLVTQHPYLGVSLENTMPFRSHFENIITKATRMLNFLHRNLHRCNQEVNPWHIHIL